MSELAISSTNWLGISYRNGAAIVFNLNNSEQWQYLKPVIETNQPKQTEDDDETELPNVPYTLLLPLTVDKPPLLPK